MFTALFAQPMGTVGFYSVPVVQQVRCGTIEERGVEGAGVFDSEAQENAENRH